MEVEYGEETTKALETYRRSTSLTQGQASEILRTIWPKAPDIEVMKAAILCKDYGLNPLMKHVFLVPFKRKDSSGLDWTMILGINALRTMARRSKPFGYHDGPRMMTDSEQEQILGGIDKDNLHVITVLVDKDGFKFPGYGSWTKTKAVHGEDKGNSPLNMAMIRSERFALQRLCPAEMTENFLEVEVADEKFIPSLVTPDALPPFVAPGFSGTTAETPRPEMTLGDFFTEALKITGKRSAQDIPGMLGLKSMNDWEGTFKEGLDQLTKLVGHKTI